MILTNKDLRVITYDKQFKVIEDRTCRQHVHQDSKTHYTKTELNQQVNQNEKALQAVTYDRTHTLAGKPIGRGSTANIYRHMSQDKVIVIMSNKQHGADSIEVVMNREKAWFKMMEQKSRDRLDG